MCRPHTGLARHEPNKHSTAACFELPYITTRTKLDSGKVQLKPMSARRMWWDRQHFPLLSKVAARVLSMHATTAASERNWSLWGRNYAKGRASLRMETADKVIFIKGNLNTAMRGVDEEIQLTYDDASDKESDCDTDRESD